MFTAIMNSMKKNEEENRKAEKIDDKLILLVSNDLITWRRATYEEKGAVLWTSFGVAILRRGRILNVSAASCRLYAKCVENW